MFEEDKLIAALWSMVFRPLSIGENGEWTVVVSSETCAFKSWCWWIRDSKQGEIVIIDDNGIQYDSYTNDTQLAICSVDTLCRHNSNIHTPTVLTHEEWELNTWV